MSNLKKALLAVLLAGVAGPAFAADPYYPPEETPPPPEVYGGWYIRGHVGMSNQYSDALESSLYLEPSILAYGWLDEGSFASAPLFGGGVGYKFNNYLRGDLTAEWRGKSDFEALDFVTNAGGTTTNDFRTKKSELLLLANAYVEGGDFHGITPYIGAGIGASMNRLSAFRDINIINGGGGWAPDGTKWNFAWALHAGLGIQATERTTIDVGYSWVNLGDAQTGTFYNDDPAFDIANDGFRLKNIRSHDFKLGVRYSLN